MIRQDELDTRVLTSLSSEMLRDDVVTTSLQRSSPNMRQSPVG